MAAIRHVKRVRENTNFRFHAANPLFTMFLYRGMLLDYVAQFRFLITGWMLVEKPA